MLLKRLELNNFVTHKKSVISFNKDGSYYIYSKNKDNKSMDANGSGKSLILDSIPWGLFGKTIRGFKTDRVIGKFGKSCSVVQIWFDGKRYIKISRFRKHSKHRNKVLIYFSSDGNNWKEDLSKETVINTDKYISKLFNMDYTLFMSGVVLTKPKGELNFCESPDSKRKEVLTKLLNLDWIDNALEYSKKNKLKLKDLSDSKKIDLESIKSKLLSNKSLLSTYVFESNNFIEIEKKKLTQLNDDLLEQYNDIDNNISILNKDINDLIISKNNEEKNLVLRKNKKDKIEEELKILNKSLSGVKDLISVGNSQIYDLKSTIDVLRSSNSIATHNQCPLCETKLKASERSSISKKLNLKFENLKKDLELNKSNESILNKKIKYLTNDLYNIDISNDNIIKYESKIENMNLEINRCNENIFKIQANIKMNDQKILNIKKSINPWNKKISKVRKIIKLYRKSLIEMKVELSKIKNESLNIDYAIEAFGNSGIKNDIISSKIRILESNINYFLSKITDGDIFVQLDNKIMHGQTERIGLLIQDNKKTTPLDYLYWSGGERTRIRFAVEWSLNSILNAPMNLIIIDEGFDDLDISGINKILEIMKSQSDKNIICVSNRPDMKNIFNNSIMVVLENEYSTVIQN